MRAPVSVATALLLCSPAFAADETSSGDKLRMLYSNQFTFTDDGLPVGLQLVGPPRADVDLLRIAQGFESATEHWRWIPGVVAS